MLVDKLKMVKNSYRLYFHYPPTFYRLHIHIMALSLGSMAALVDRAHSVENVINNLKVDSEYYGKVSLLKLI